MAHGSQSPHRTAASLRLTGRLVPARRRARRAQCAGCHLCPELRRGGHARVEDRVRTWKDCDLSNLLFKAYWCRHSVLPWALLCTETRAIPSGGVGASPVRTPSGLLGVGTAPPSLLTGEF